MTVALMERRVHRCDSCIDGEESATEIKRRTVATAQQDNCATYRTRIPMHR